MKYFGITLYTLFLFSLIVMVTGCPEEVNPVSDPPGPVRIIPGDSDTSAVERGLRNAAGTTNVIIEWEKLEATDIAIKEYRVFRSKGLDSAFRQIGSVLSGEDPLYVDNTTARDTTYYYYIIAVDSRNKTSDTSVYFLPDSVNKYIQFITIGHSASGVHPLPFPFDTTATKPVFEWCYPTLPTPVKCIIKIANSGLQTIWVAQKPTGIFETCGEGANREFLTYHNISYTNNDSLQSSNPGEVKVYYAHPVWAQTSRLAKDNYYWRVDCFWSDGRREARSNWIQFTISKD